jgi:hypothetical protein
MAEETSNEELPTIVDFGDDIGDAEPPVPLPVGEYDAQIVHAEQRVSQTSGNRYAAVHFRIMPDQYPADFPVEEEPDGVLIIYRRVVLEPTGRARWNAKQFCTAIGADLGRNVDLKSWVGCTARVGVEHDTYQGVTRAAIGRVSAIG